MNCSCAATFGCRGGSRTSSTTGGRCAFDGPSVEQMHCVSEVILTGNKICLNLDVHFLPVSIETRDTLQFMSDADEHAL